MGVGVSKGWVYVRRRLVPGVWKKSVMSGGSCFDLVTLRSDPSPKKLDKTVSPSDLHISHQKQLIKYCTKFSSTVKYPLPLQKFEI